MYDTLSEDKGNNIIKSSVLCAELNTVLILEGSYVGTVGTFIHQRDDVLALPCRSLEVLHCKEPVGFSAWTGIIVDLETGDGLKKY